MRLKGILHCPPHEEAIIAQGVYKWVTLRKDARSAPAESVLVLIGRHLNADAIAREWMECVRRT
jgi:G3E family GTPase